LARAEPSDVSLRLASAAVLAPITLAAIWLGGAAFAALVTAAAAAMGWEWATLTGCRWHAATVLVLANALACVALASRAPFAAIVIAGAGAALAFLVAPPAPRAWAALGGAAIALPSLAVLWLAGELGRLGLLWLFLTVWATDSGAYLAGRTFGGPRLAPALSPNKTWAGLLGGLAAASLVGFLCARLGGASTDLVPASVGLAIAAQLGDLAESAAKRRFGVKDSSRLIPGHGGLLDRLDGMLGASAAAWLVAFLSGAGPLLGRGS
jgi:phosphatidate cytidylyltransferase